MEQHRHSLFSFHLVPPALVRPGSLDRFWQRYLRPITWTVTLLIAASLVVITVRWVWEIIN